MNVLKTAAVVFLFQSTMGFASESVEIDFVADREFPSSSEKKREFKKTMLFEVSDFAVTVTGENEFGGAVEVSRRGPGGLGVKGNGDRNAAGEGTTSGNRINNGEHLIFSFADADGNPIDVKVLSVVIDRIVRDSKNFSDVSATGYQFFGDGKLLASGDLDIGGGETKGGPIMIDIEAAAPVSQLRITNGAGFHPIANRFRVSAVTLSATD